MYYYIDTAILKKIFVVQNSQSEIPNVGLVEKWHESNCISRFEE